MSYEHQACTKDLRKVSNTFQCPKCWIVTTSSIAGLWGNSIKYNILDYNSNIGWHTNSDSRILQFAPRHTTSSIVGLWGNSIKYNILDYIIGWHTNSDSRILQFALRHTHTRVSYPISADRRIIASCARIPLKG